MSWDRTSVLSFPIPPAARASIVTMLRATVRTGLGSKACDPSSNAPRTKSACSSDKKYRAARMARLQMFLGRVREQSASQSAP